MAKDSLIFKDAEKARNAITQQQRAEILKIYQKWADEIGEKAKIYSHKTAPSYAIAERQMKELEKQLRATSDKVASEIYSGIKSSIYVVSEAVVNTNKEWLKSLGFDGETLDIAFNYVPDEIVQKLITGQIYDSSWSLSKRLWDDKEETLRELYKITAGGIAQNKSIYEIAKDLEKYVSPTAAKPWNLVDKDGKKIYPKQVDYNAQRLARTLVQHGYQQSFIETTKENPFIIDYIWNANGNRVCELCIERDGQHYPKDNLPMDHPNGMCTIEPNISETMIDDLANWFNSPDGTYPEIDDFAKNFGYEIKTSPKEKVYSYKAYTSDDKKTVEQLYKEQISQYTRGQRAALKRYTGDTKSTAYEYEKTNNYLRGFTNKISASNERMIKNIDSAIQNFEVKEAFTVKRGVNIDCFDDLLSGVDIKNIDEVSKALTGVKFMDKGYMSASWDTWDGFYRDVNMYINVPEGKGYGAMMGDVTSRDENEFILRRDTTLLIKEVTAGDNGALNVVCDIIG